MSISIRHINYGEVIWSSDLKSLTKLVGLFLSRCANGDAEVAWPSQARIASETGMSERSVRNHLDILEDGGWILRDRGGLSVGGEVNITRYILDIPHNFKAQFPTAGDAGSMPNQHDQPAGDAVGPTAGDADYRGVIQKQKLQPISKTEKTIRQISEYLGQQNKHHLEPISVLLTNYGIKGVREISSIGARAYADNWTSLLNDFDLDVVRMSVMKHLEDKPGYWPTVHEIRNNCLYYSGKRSKNVRQKKKKFTKPTLADVIAYCHERSNHVDPEQFIDHYEARGWQYKTGQRMKDWKAAVRTWERNSIGAQSNGSRQEAPRKLSAAEQAAAGAKRLTDRLDRERSEREIHGTAVGEDGLDLRP